MRKYLVGLGAILIAIVLAVVISGQMRTTATAEVELPTVVVAPPAEAGADPSSPAPAEEMSEAAPAPATQDTGRSRRPGSAAPRTTAPAPARAKPRLTETARPKAPIGSISPSGKISALEPAQSAEGGAILKRAAAAYSKLSSFKADFAQWQENPLLGKRTSSRGTVYQRRPDRFLMKFSQPAGDVIVSDGEYFWMYYPSVDVKQVLRTRAADAGGLDLQAQFVGDPTARFRYTLQGSETVAGRSARVLTLVPREADAGYKSLKVWIDDRDHLVRRFELASANGVVQHFDLTNFEPNPTLGDQLFRFTPPAGARVVER